MADFEAPWPIHGHGEVVTGLWRAAAADRLPHALLFNGRGGLGKFRAALALAQGLLCARGPREVGPCQSCGPCKRFLSGGHPDLLVIDPPQEVDAHIRVGYIVRREGSGEPELSAEQFLSLKPMEGGWRIVIVRGAERMLEQAQNALLKMLEEPGQGVLWILIAERAAELLPTVRSRAVVVRFAALADADCMSVLAEHGLARDQSRLLARWSGGSPGMALALSERGAVDLRAVLVGLLCAQADSFAAAGALEAVDGRFEGKTPTARERERARTVLDLAAALLGDLARLRAGVPPERVAHGDLGTRMGEMALASHPELLSLALEGLVRLRADVELNLDPGLILERAALILSAREPAQLLC